MHSSSILSQAINNFTNPSHEKHLFKERVSFNGRQVRIRQVHDFESGGSDDIKIQFLTIQLLLNRMTTDGENRITKADFERNKTVIIADEAHRLNVMTRSSDKAKQDERNWEQVVVESLNANEDNLPT